MIELITSGNPLLDLIFIVIGLSFPILISYYFLRNWKKAFIIFFGILLMGFSIKNEPQEQFNILFPIFTLFMNGLGLVIIFSQFIPLKKLKKLKLFK